MTISYKKLWKLLIDRDMKKKDFKNAAGLTDYVIGKLSRNESITTDTIAKICRALNCTFEDFAEISDEK